MSLTLVWTFIILVVVLAWLYDMVNGMNDCANAIATTVSTRALSPLGAILLAAILNFAGALVSTEVARTVGKGVIPPDFFTGQKMLGSIVMVSALVGAVVWGYICTRGGIPISITHSIVGGLAGAGVCAGGLGLLNPKGLTKIIVAMVFSPIVGFLFGYFLMAGVYWVARNMKPQLARPLFRRLQLISASYMAFSHGMNDAQNAMGVIAATLIIYGMVVPTAANEFPVPLWVRIGSAFFMGLGTFIGGKAVIRTMGQRIFKIEPEHGFAAETGAASVILGMSLAGAPISTTHVVSTSIMGVGATAGFKNVRWGIAGHIIMTWILTIPGSALIAAAVFALLKVFAL